MNTSAQIETASTLDPNLDEVEEIELESDSPMSHGYRELSPLNHRLTRSHTPPDDEDGAARIAAAQQAPRCRHIKAAGNRCKAPALRGGEYCHLHHRLRVGPRLIHPTLTQLEDAHGIQVALMEVLTGILDGRLDNKTGALLLYGLQTAVANLKHMPDLDEDDITTEEPIEDEPDFDPEANAAAEKAAAADAVAHTYDELAARYPIHARPTGNTARDARHAESLASYFGYDPSQPNAGETPAPHLGGAGLQACNSSQNKEGVLTPEVPSAAKAVQREVLQCRAEALLHPQSQSKDEAPG